MSGQSTRDDVCFGSADGGRREGWKDLHRVFADRKKAYGGGVGGVARLCEEVVAGVGCVWQCGSDEVAQGMAGGFKAEVGQHQGSALRPSLFGKAMGRLAEIILDSPGPVRFADDTGNRSEVEERRSARGADGRMWSQRRRGARAVGYGFLLESTERQRKSS